MADRITWEHGRYSVIEGTVGGIHLFTISWRSTRAGMDWLLSGQVPGFAQAFGDYDTTDEAKAAAEQVLVAFVDRLGARF